MAQEPDVASFGHAVARSLRLTERLGEVDGGGDGRPVSREPN
jgi:hypothetical protein